MRENKAMHQINLFNNIKLRENQNSNNEDYNNRLNKKSMYSRKTIILIVIAVIAGLGLVAAVIFISIALAVGTSNSMNTTIITTILPSTENNDTHHINSMKLSTTMPTITKTTVITRTSVATKNSSVTTT
ncbi:unnamed protein product [Rotaria socialis]|uniref:Uncharacterized protein n=2 Tax=Rotaria socialis TaxID=392032 RepID=A0A821BFN6_9BILA|nr:unnamed protein product [Rotaria socialis]CAF4220685.1 unnamed protein product [Rotaria socialis]CAF4378925.1 unnamed protein product [Rotaria socialis]CAF4594311.1 unnamed protein product [Rotaria socialis]CAF4756175.1 unnamed protein product [Rotaria socialis]